MQRITADIASGGTANLGSAQLHGANFSGAVLPGIDLRNAQLFQARFDNADLRNADLRDAKINKAEVSEAIFCGANLEGVDFSGTNFKENSCPDFRFANLQNASFCVQQLNSCNVSNATWRYLKILRDKKLRPEQEELPVLKGLIAQRATQREEPWIQGRCPAAGAAISSTVK